MSTRGVYGFRKDGVDKLTYNHFDSYPSGLGADILKFLKNTTPEMLEKYFNSIVMVHADDAPDEEQREVLSKYYTAYVNGATDIADIDDWYCLLYRLQGDLEACAGLVDKSVPVFMIDSHGFIKESLICEYGYVINLDEQVLEFWKGFQMKPWKDNRYGTEEKNGYYPCKLITKIPLSVIATTPLDVLVQKLSNSEDDECETITPVHAELNVESNDVLMQSEIDEIADRYPDIDLIAKVSVYDNMLALGKALMQKQFEIEDGLWEYIDVAKYAKSWVKTHPNVLLLQSGRVVELE